jgi:hypothetical protein
MSLDFLTRYLEIQHGSGRTRGVSPTGDLALWDGFVKSCEAGYDDSLYDYLYELQVRDALELALNDAPLTRLEGYDRFQTKVQAIDQRFKQVATTHLPVANPTGLGWWRLVVPDIGEADFAHNLQEEFGVVITIV